MSVPRWYEIAAEELEQASADGDIDFITYRNEMMDLDAELNETG